MKESLRNLAKTMRGAAGLPEPLPPAQAPGAAPPPAKGAGQPPAPAGTPGDRQRKAGLDMGQALQAGTR
jgi:hypothetical protein